jgi:transposase
MVVTYKFKLRNKRLRSLQQAASKANFVWNYCNQISCKAIKDLHRFLTGYDLANLTSGTAKMLNVSSVTIQAVCETYAKSRKQAHKRKLRWRNGKSLGWVPFKSNAIKIQDDKIKFCGTWYRFFKSQEIEGEILTGAFVQDATREWYVCITCEVNPLPKAPIEDPIGIDLGLTSIATTSNEERFENPRTYRKNELKLAKAQRYRKRKQATRIYRKIKRIRQDNLHKISTKLARTYQKIFVGDLNLKSTKSTNDSAYRGLVKLLEYKVSRRQGVFLLVGEFGTTQTCCACLAKSGPSGVEGLAEREWTCGSCKQTHDRDINAAKNILRLGHETLKTRCEQLVSASEGILGL